MNIEQLNTLKIRFMKHYTSCLDAINDLHRKGYTNDFQLVGNDLLFVQEGFFIRSGEFSIQECYSVDTPDRDDMQETIVFGVVASCYDIKGILLNHYRSYTAVTPPVLLKKLNEFNIRNLMRHQQTKLNTQQ